MRQSLKGIKKLPTIIVLLATISIMTTPAVFADPDPGQGASPQSVVQNGVTTLKIGGGGAQSAYTEVDEIAVYTDEDEDSCPLVAPGGGEKRFDLRDDTGAIVTAILETSTSSISMPWGTGNTFSITTSGTVTLSGSGTYLWADSAGDSQTPADSTAQIDILTFLSCGSEGADENNVLGYSGDADFQVVAPVAGELIPIEMTAVLLAGTMTNQLLLLPILGVVAASAFVVLKIKVQRK